MYGAAVKAAAKYIVVGLAGHEIGRSIVGKEERIVERVIEKTESREKTPEIDGNDKILYVAIAVGFVLLLIMLRKYAKGKRTPIQV